MWGGGVGSHEAPVSSACSAPTQTLTRMYFLLLDVFFQLPPKALLAAIFSKCSIIHQQKMGMKTVETDSLAQGISQRLVGLEHLNHCGGKRAQGKTNLHRKTSISDLITQQQITVSVLTSLPMRSMLLSITPHGVIPTVFLFLRSWPPNTFTASPTYLDTPGENVKSC